MTSNAPLVAPDSSHCFHCGLPVPANFDYRVEILGTERPMCCHGCQAVAQAIVAGGLERFYEHRTAVSQRPEDLVPEQLRRLDLYDQPRLQEGFVEVDERNLKTASLILEGITCAACVWLSERHVRTLSGVVEFHVNYSTHRARVRWDDSRVRLSDILKAIAAIGYVAHPYDPGRQDAVYRRERQRALRRLAVAGLCSMQVMMLGWSLYAMDYDASDVEDMRAFLRWVSALLTVPVVFYSSQTFFVAAWRELRRGRLGMDVPVSLAVILAFVASLWATATHGPDVYYDSVTMFAFFLLTGRYLEMGARHGAGQAAEALVRLLPATATRLRDGAEEIVAVAELVPGDRVLIRPGETVPADGAVVDGRSSVDESLLTGESLPRARSVGDALVGGSTNVESPLEMRVEKVGDDTVVSAIVRLLDRAQAEKPRVALLADRVAAWFVGALLIVAVVVALWWWPIDPSKAFYVTLSLLVVTCPCALSLATPVAVVAATGSLTRLGLLTTRGHALETLARTTHILFDKTGTLTRGELRLHAVRTLGAVTRERALAVAAALERRSEHPVGRVLVASGADGLAATEVIATPGEGVEGIVEGIRYRVGKPGFVAALAGVPVTLADEPGATRVALGDERGLLAVFVLRDELRPDAKATLQRLRWLGVEVELLSGDSEDAVAHVAKELDVATWRGGVSPAQKLERVRALQGRGAVVAMVGDGVNDAPVLAGANVSVAMGSGTQLAHASADMVILSERLENLAAGVAAARKTRGIIRENLFWALFYNLLAVPLAAAGWVTPWMASIGMSASSLVVVLNALRLKTIHR
jgi:Cu2+-exporting ATPase